VAESSIDGDGAACDADGDGAACDVDGDGAACDGDVGGDAVGALNAGADSNLAMDTLPPTRAPREGCMLSPAAFTSPPW